MNTAIEVMSGLNVLPLYAELMNTPSWQDITIRQTYEGSAHADTETIFIRGPKSFYPEDYFNDLGSYDYPHMNLFPQAMVLIEQLREMLPIIELGRVLIVKLKPGGYVTPHIDEGLYADHFARFHVVISTNSECVNTTGGQSLHWEAGSVWWFNHKMTHTATNNGLTDRIHMIVDAVTPFTDNLSN